ncbi:MAG: hypothetical protein MUO99_04565 [Dehalococcoidales bacterium]|nr:hypothetical protein [Dehalococcoidales bacterium]
MSESFAIISQDEVKRLLAVAKRHFGYITRSRSKTITLPGDLKLDHAIVASIFSAAAIEVGLNLFITIPILLIKDENIRRFFGVLVSKHLRLSVREKIQFAYEFCPQIKRDKVLLRKVRALFAYRNSVLHSSPEYAEPLGLPDLDWEELPSKITEEDLIPQPQLSSRGTSSSEMEEAFQHYQTALDFLGKLTVYAQESEGSALANSA